MSDRQVATAQILENNPDVKQARKTGKISKATKELAKLGLSDKQTNRFHSFPPQLQSLLLKETKNVTKRLLGMDRFGPGQAYAFFTYKPETRTKILGLPDEAAIALRASPSRILFKTQIKDSSLWRNTCDSSRRTVPAPSCNAGTEKKNGPPNALSRCSATSAS